METAILNTTIVTAEGDYRLRRIDVHDALEIIAAGSEIRSYVGHEATRTALSRLLGVELGFSRDLFAHAPGQNAICFKLRGRLENGRELDEAELNRIGYDLFVLTRTA